MTVPQRVDLPVAGDGGWFTGEDKSLRLGVAKAGVVTPSGPADMEDLSGWLIKFWLAKFWSSEVAILEKSTAAGSITIPTQLLADKGFFIVTIDRADTLVWNEGRYPYWAARVTSNLDTIVLEGYATLGKGHP